MALAFDSSAIATTAVRMTGIIEARNGGYFLIDETTNVRVRLEGNDVSKYVGKKVEITGSSISEANAAAGASQLVRAVSITLVSGKHKAAGGTRISGVATAAIIGGVAIVGTVGGLGAAGTFSGDASISRQ